MVTDIEELEVLNTAEIHAWTLNAKEVLMPENGEEFVLSSQMDQSSWQEEIWYSEHPPFFQDHPARGEEHNDVLQGESDGSQPLDQKADDIEARTDFWSISGDHVYRHVEPSVNVYVPHEGSIPIPLKCIDVVRWTNTTLDGCIVGKSF